MAACPVAGAMHVPGGRWQVPGGSHWQVPCICMFRWRNRRLPQLFWVTKGACVNVATGTCHSCPDKSFTLLVVYKGRLHVMHHVDGGLLEK